MERRKTLQMVTEDLFPGASEMARGEFWTGLRPMTPDGTPVVGATSVHGSSSIPVMARWAGRWLPDRGG